MNVESIDVYIKKFPFEVANEKIFPEMRLKEIESCKSQKVKDEKFYSWKLLEEAFFNSFGIKIEDVGFSKHGLKWECDRRNFSISHSHHLVAVALSNQNIGIDIEKVDFERFSLLQPEKVLTEEEQKKLKIIDKKEIGKHINQLWTKKEAIFKKNGGKIFIPNKIETKNKNIKLIQLKSSENNFYLSICGNNIDKINYFVGEDIEIIKN